jgi:hypothetical protein
VWKVLTASFWDLGKRVAPLRKDLAVCRGIKTGFAFKQARIPIIAEMRLPAAAKEVSQEASAAGALT